MKRLFALLAFSLLIPSFLAAQCPAGLVSNGAGGCVAPMDFYAVASLPPGTTGITRTVRLTTDNSLWRGDGALANWHQISVGVASDGSSTFPGPVTIGNTLPVGAPANSLGVGGNLYVSGNVGIGTPSPSELLDVNGRVHLAQTTAPGTTTDKLYNVGGTLYWNGTALGGGGSQTPWTSNINAAGYTLSGNSTSGGNLTLDSTSSATKGYVLLNPSGGNVGIGTTSPSQKLEVNGSIQMNGFLDFGGGHRESVNSGILRFDQGTNFPLGYYLNVGSGSGLFINSSGNVGIGTTSPLATLDVHGHVASTAAAAPGISGCGSGSPAISANATDEGGTVTFGTAPGTCVITFATTYVTNSPKCSVSFQGGVPAAYSVSLTAITISATGLTGAVDYRCAQ